jgi:cbb3-type cytochrome c oxidase subunit II
MYTPLPDWAQSSGYCVFHHADRPKLGRYDQRFAHAPRFMGQSASGAGSQVFCGCSHLLRHGDLRRANALLEKCQCDRPLYRLDRSARSRRWLGLEWFYHLRYFVLVVPKLWNTKLHSTKLANAHFWIGTMGIVVYAVPMYIAGIVQGLMWKQFDANGFLEHPNFLETVTQIVPMYMLRSLGGLLYLIGALLMVYNLIATIKAGTFLKEEKAEAPALEKTGVTDTYWHRWIERKPIQMLILTLVLLLVGTFIELIPTFLVKSNVPTIASVKPYTPLELEGRDLYIREGCYLCHSQMVRPFRNEELRYQGEYSKAGEYVYDHPFQWGSKRTGPDLHRVGGRWGDDWHYRHMIDPRSVSPGSIMPAYAHMGERDLDISLTTKKAQRPCKPWASPTVIALSQMQMLSCRHNRLKYRQVWRNPRSKRLKRKRSLP